MLLYTKNTQYVKQVQVGIVAAKIQENQNSQDTGKESLFTFSS